MWLFLAASVGLVFVSGVLLAMAVIKGDDRAEYIWSTSLLDAIMFVIGSMYFVCGSYPPPSDVLLSPHVVTSMMGTHVEGQRYGTIDDTHPLTSSVPPVAWDGTLV
jgi:hypothetical protein